MSYEQLLLKRLRKARHTAQDLRDFVLAPKRLQLYARIVRDLEAMESEVRNDS